MTEMLKKISLKVWDKELFLKYWSRMLVATFYKKGNKRDPANYRGIALLSIPRKIFFKVIFNKMRDGIEEKTKESQNSFRPS